MSLAAEILLQHLPTSQIRASGDLAAALDDLRRMAAARVSELCRAAEVTLPERAPVLMTAAEDLARIVGEVGDELESERRRDAPAKRRLAR